MLDNALRTMIMGLNLSEDEQQKFIDSRDLVLGKVFAKLSNFRLECQVRNGVLHFFPKDEPNQTIALVCWEKFKEMTEAVLSETLSPQVEDFVRTYNLEPNSCLGA